MANSDSAVTSQPFKFGIHCELAIPDYKQAIISIPALDRGIKLESKDLMMSGEVGFDGKFTLEQHLAYLLKRGDIDSTSPLLVLGLRNNLVNWRAPVIRSGQVYAADPEQPEQSQRSYFGLGARNGQIVFEQALGRSGETEEWSEFFCAGIPVLWDGLDQRQLMEAILTEAADHSHVFEIPRGNHPLATPESRDIFDRLHQTFRAQIAESRSVAADALRRVVDEAIPPLQRCDDYFHAVIGGQPDGSLYCIFAQGRLETLGQMLADRGCYRAVCVENSGSVMPTFLPKGLAGDIIPLVRAPNFRPAGRAVLVLRLASPAFEASPLLVP